MNKTGISILQILYCRQQQLNVIQNNKDSTGGKMMTGLRKQRIFVNENLQWASSAYHNQQIGQSDMHQ